MENTISARMLRIGPREAVLEANDPDLRLLDRCRRGDAHAFEALFRKYQNYVYNISLGMLCNAEDAADITQETFLRLHRSLDSFRGDASFSTWLYRIVANTTRDHVRKSKTLQARFEAEFESSERIVDDTGNEPGVVPAGPTALAEERQAPVRLPVAHRIVLESLDRLTRTERKVLEAWAANLSNPQIGDLLRMSNQAVRTALSRAKATQEA